MSKWQSCFCSNLDLETLGPTHSGQLLDLGIGQKWNLNLPQTRPLDICGIYFLPSAIQMSYIRVQNSCYFLLSREGMRKPKKDPG